MGPEGEAAKPLGGRFALLREIGVGGMAAVYLGRDEVLDRAVAVKILKSGFGDSHVGDRFRREGRTAAKLSHPNIVQVYDAGEDLLDGREVSYVVMEYVPGGDLGDAIGERGSLPEREVARIGADLAGGLAHAHGRGVVHRDIKPLNVLMDEYGSPKLADFGLARALDATYATRTGDYLGTALYSAPEQLRGQAITPKSDVYSLGATLYHAAVGKPPFSGSPIGIAGQQLVGSVVPPRERGASVSKNLEALILSCLAKDPADRPDAAGLREGLLRAGAAIATGAGPATPSPAVQALKTAGTAGISGVARAGGAAKEAGEAGVGAVRRRLNRSGTPPGPPEITVSTPATRTFGPGPRRRLALVGMVGVALVLLLVLGVSALVGSGDEAGAQKSDAGQQEKAAEASPKGTPEAAPKEDPDQAPDAKEDPKTGRGSGSSDGGGASDGAEVSENLTATDAGQTVLTLYALLTNKDYKRSYSLLSDRYKRAKFPSQEAWTDDAKPFKALTFIGTPETEASGGEATVRGDVMVIYSGATLQEEHRVWRLVAEDGGWKLDGMSGRLIKG